jgi:hypothetical protein
VVAQTEYESALYAVCEQCLLDVIIEKNHIHRMPTTKTKCQSKKKRSGHSCEHLLALSLIQKLARSMQIKRCRRTRAIWACRQQRCAHSVGIAPRKRRPQARSTACDKCRCRCTAAPCYRAMWSPI